MKQIERASIMRIVSDMVKADAILDLQELDFLEQIRCKYGIKKDDEVLADTMTLADSFETLQTSSKSLTQDLYGDLKAMALSDNYCSREEAMNMLAVTACLTDQLSEQAHVYSIDLPLGVTVDGSQVLYVEGEYYKDTNHEISSSYREIVNEWRLIGLNFVYIPQVGAHYRSLGKEDLQKLVSFLYPQASERQMEKVTRQITTLSTSDFYKSEIIGHMNMVGFAHALPSLMLWIGCSWVGGKKKDNFLVITMEDDEALVVTRRIVDAFVGLFKPRILNPVYEEDCRFVYHGFHKQLLDSLIYKKGIRSSVVVDIIHGDILLPEAETKVSGLHRREKALYALILMESASGGVNFNKPDGAKSLEKYKRRMSSIQRKYEIIYENFGGERANAPKIELSENRLPMMSLIKRQFRALGDLLDQPDDYLTQRNMFGNYCVALPPELCRCLDVKTNAILPFGESDFWRGLLAL